MYLPVKKCDHDSNEYCSHGKYVATV
jgi:hypothetical protein